MNRILRGAALVTIFLGCATVQAQAKDLFKVLEDIEIHGFASASYSYNFNEPVDGTNCGKFSGGGCLRIFDRDDNSFKFDVGELVFLKEAANRGDIGFRTDLAFGFSVPEVSKAASSDSIGGSNDDFDVQQAYVSWNAPIGKGINIDFGKFITHIGLEVIEGYDGWNNNFSRSFLFGLAIPFVHTGVRASYDINDQVSVMGGIFNGWDTTTDNNDSKTLGAQVAYTPWDGGTFLFNWIGGNETATDNDYRTVFDFVGDIALTDRISLQLNSDYGFEENARGVGLDAEWWGGAVVLRYNHNSWMSLNLRTEYFDDDDGVRTGLIQELWEITITPEFRINQNMVVRLEYRHDESDSNVFDDEGVPTDNQDTVAVNALLFF